MYESDYSQNFWLPAALPPLKSPAIQPCFESMSATEHMAAVKEVEWRLCSGSTKEQAHPEIQSYLLGPLRTGLHGRRIEWRLCSRQPKTKSALRFSVTYESHYRQG